MPRIVAFGYVFFGYGMVIVQAFNGAGDSHACHSEFIWYWMFQIPLAYMLAMKLDFGSVRRILGHCHCGIGPAIIAILLFRRGT